MPEHSQTSQGPRLTLGYTLASRFDWSDLMTGSALWTVHFDPGGHSSGGADAEQKRRERACPLVSASTIHSPKALGNWHSGDAAVMRKNNVRVLSLEKT
jgi:hypothetical protein